MWLENIVQQALRSPQRIAFQGKDLAMTYGELANDVYAIVQDLKPRIPEGAQRVMLHNINHGYVHLALMMAIARLGLISVAATEESAEDEAAFYKADFVIGMKEQPGVSFVIGNGWLPKIRQALPAGDSATFGKLRADAPVRIITTSGTTGQRKKILFDNDLIFRSALRTILHNGFSNKDRMLVVMNHTTGTLLAIIAILMVGGTVIYPPGLPWDYKNFLVYRPTFTAVSAQQLKVAVAALPKGFPIQESLQVNVGGSMADPNVIRAARLRLTPHIIKTYGATEIGRVAHMDARFSAAQTNLVGVILPDVEVEIVDSQDGPRPQGQPGIVRLRGATAVANYADDPDTSGRIFKDGWFYPGDLGAIGTGGQLHIVGRVSDLMNFGGVKIHPEQIETFLRGQPGIKEVVAFSLGLAQGFKEESLWLAVVKDEAFDQRKVSVAVTKQFIDVPRPRYLFLAAIPRNAAGKIDREKLRGAALATLNEPKKKTTT